MQAPNRFSQYHFFLEGLIEKELVIYTEIAQLLQWRKHLETLRFLATGKYNYALETTWVSCSPPFLGQLLLLLESFFSKKLCTVYYIFSESSGNSQKPRTDF